MKRIAIGLLVTVVQAAWGQSADRTVATPTQPVQNDTGIVSELIGVLSPAEPTPLSEKQRFHDYVVSITGPVAVFSASASAAISQGIDSPPEWGQGGRGYSKRAGNNLAYNGVRNTLTYAVSAALHEDNRYFASGRATFGGRLLYALASPAIARKEDGRHTVSVSSLFGIVGVSAISRAWSPGSWQGGDNVGWSIGLTYLGMAGFNVAREFVPDIVRHFRR